MASAPAALVDTHCHLQLLEERGLLSAALDSAAESGVEQIVCVGLNVEDSDRCRLIAESHRGVLFTVGWHPHETAPPDTAQTAALAELLRHPRAVAVGEIGLDVYFRPGYHETPLEVQQQGMSVMLDLARDAGLPVVVHDRDAHEEVLALLEGWSDVTGVMHCFSGDAAHARRCRERGFMLSFSGIVTFANAAPIQDAARQVDEGGFVVETDAPFLAPVPYRGRACLPEYVAATAGKVAELRGIDPGDARRLSTANARRLFALDPGDRLGA